MNKIEPRQSEFMEWLAETIRTEAKEKRDNAGYQGSHSDGGAGSMLELHAIWSDGFICGRNGEPLASSKYSDYATRWIAETDPEYVEYIRLKQKFESC